MIYKVTGYLYDINSKIKPKYKVPWKSLNVLADCNLKMVDCKKKKSIVVKWLLSPSGRVKLNVDGSSLGNPGEAGSGGILRDELGRIILAYSCYLGTQNNTFAEISALLIGLRLCGYFDLCNVEVETDSILVYNWVSKKDKIPVKYSFMLQDVIQLMELIVLKMDYVYREGNITADSLAKNGAKGVTEVYFGELELPKLIYGAYKTESAGVKNIRRR